MIEREREWQNRLVMPVNRSIVQTNVCKCLNPTEYLIAGRWVGYQPKHSTHLIKN